MQTGLTEIDIFQTEGKREEEVRRLGFEKCICV